MQYIKYKILKKLVNLLATVPPTQVTSRCEAWKFYQQLIVLGQVAVSCLFLEKLETILNMFIHHFGMSVWLLPLWQINFTKNMK